jgi:hypothetical protein
MNTQSKALTFQAVCLTGVLCGIAAAGLGIDVTLWVFVLPSPALAWIAITDHRTHRIPATLSNTAIGLAAVGVMLAAQWHAGPVGQDILRDAGIGGVVFPTLLGVLWLIAPTQIGFGDVRLSISLGLIIGVVNPVLVPATAALACGLAALQMLIAGSGPWSTRTAGFAPALIAATYTLPALLAPA